MLCYKDRTFCSAKCHQSPDVCNRVLTPGVWNAARQCGLDVSVADLSFDCEMYMPESEAEETSRVEP
jgi:hypothetical protein